MSWDPELYLRFGGDRARPFFELLAATELESPRFVIDLGCGPGHLAAAMAARWPEATILGLDSSAEMIAKAQSHASAQLSFEVQDLREFTPARAPDLVISNAVLHWVPDHAGVISRVTSWLGDAGVVAIQVPGNFEAPAARLLRETAQQAPFDSWISELRPAGIETPERYFEILSELGLRPRVWETTYMQCLEGDDAVFHWTAGTAQLPFIRALEPGGEALVAQFREVYAARLREAYPGGRYGTLFPFRRVFAVGQR